MHAGRCATMSGNDYQTWRRGNAGVRVIVEEGFLHDRDVVFEDTLSPLYRTLFSWRKAYLDGWWFHQKKTGLMTVQERLHALLEYVDNHLCHLCAPPPQRPA